MNPRVSEMVIARKTAVIGNLASRYGIPRALASVSLKPMRANSGSVTRLRRVSMLRAQAEQIEKRLQAIVEANPDLVAMADIKTRQILYLNRAGRKILQIGAEENISGLGLADIHSAAAVTRLAAEIIPTAIQKGTWSGETALRTRSKGEIPVFQVVLAHKSSDTVFWKHPTGSKPWRSGSKTVMKFACC